MNNRNSLKSLFTGLVACVAGTVGLLAGTLGNAPIISEGQTKMLGGIVVVRLSHNVDVDHPESALPPGYTVVERFLAPSQTEYFSGKSLKQARMDAALYSAEDRLVRTIVVGYAGPIHPKHAALSLMKEERIEFAEPYYVGDMHALPNDPLVSQQTALSVLKMSQAWDIERGAVDIVVGISDNGVDQDHEDLSGNLWVNSGEVPNNGVDDDGNGYIDDHKGYNFAWQVDGTDPGVTINYGNSGHGTKVAGIACASTNNTIGIAGVGYNCRMFPMKTALKNASGIVYGYQSLIYSARMGFDVVNCSWGTVKPWSPVDQSVIDYCIANDVVVVASAGNHGSVSTDEAWTNLNFPSAYEDVMGVGETNTSDKVTSTSGLGVNATVMAPGRAALTTDVGGGYTTSGITGTSFASPMGAGIAALVKSRYPGLSPHQVITHLRLTADNIDADNLALASVVPGRLNAERALDTPPLSQSGFRIVEVIRRHPDGSIAQRYGAGDTLDMVYVVVNDLGTSSEATFTLSAAKLNGWSIIPPSNTESLGALVTGANAAVGPFRVILNGTDEKPLLLQLNIFEGAREDALFDNMPGPSRMSIMQNDKLAYSVGDDGTFGFSSNSVYRTGIGFIWKEREWLLWPSGFLFSEGGSRSLKAYNNVTYQSDFVTEKAYVEPQRERGVMTDAGIGAKEIGVRVALRHSFPASDALSTVIEVDLENRSSQTLNDVAAGYFLDWDIGYSGQNNTTRLAPEALPTTFRETGEAQLFQRDGVDAVVVCAATTNETSFQGQAAGMMLGQIVDDGDGLTDADVVTLLSSGTSIQTSEAGDACGVIGMRFPGPLAPGEHRRFMVAISVGATVEEAAAASRQAILEPNSVSEVVAPAPGIYPDPSTEVVRIQHGVNGQRMRLVDLSGRDVLQQDIAEGSSSTMLNVSSLASGAYVVVVEYNNAVSSALIRVMH